MFFGRLFSTDKTVEIAKSLGANVIQHAWPGNQAEQFNWALKIWLSQPNGFTSGCR